MWEMKGVDSLLQAGGKNEKGRYKFSSTCLPRCSFGTVLYKTSSRAASDLLLLSDEL